MAEPSPQSTGMRWTRTGWISLLLGWLGYFALMAFSQRSPLMHTYAGYMAIVVFVVVIFCAVLAIRSREGGYVGLLVGVLATPVIWYFVSVAAMAFIAYQAG